MVIYDDNTRPRALVQGFDKSHPFASAIEKYCGTVDYHDGVEPRRWQSWDVLIVMGDPQLINVHEAEHMHVVQIGGHPFGEQFVAPNVSFPSRWAVRQNPSYGEELEIPDQVKGDWRELAKKVLVPALQATPPPRMACSTGGRKAVKHFVPLVSDLDGRAFALRYGPQIGPAEVLYLPDEAVDDLAPWLLAAFKTWSAEAPDVFPSEPDWVSDPRWMTSAELELRTGLEKQCAELRRITLEAERRVAAAEEQLAAAREAADAGRRMLLTGTGDELVDVLEQVLTDLGFSVRNMDKEGAREKREDLRVSWQEWTAIAEAKGYNNGGKPSDLQKIERFAGMYGIENGQKPDAKWYIVNQFRDRDPSGRRPLMRNHPADVEVFAEEGGLVIDTCDLFQLDKAVSQGRISREAARQSLIESVGFFELPAEVEG